MKKHVFVLSLLSFVLAVSAAVEPRNYYGKIGKRLADSLPKYHVLQQPMDDEISRRAWTNLVTFYDFDHSVFLKSDLDRLAAHEKTIDDELRAADVSFDTDSIFIGKAPDSSVRPRGKMVITNSYLHSTCACNLKDETGALSVGHQSEGLLYIEDGSIVSNGLLVGIGSYGIGIAILACLAHAYYTCGVLRRANALYYFGVLLACAYYLVKIKQYPPLPEDEGKAKRRLRRREKADSEETI